MTYIIIKYVFNLWLTLQFKTILKYESSIKQSTFKNHNKIQYEIQTKYRLLLLLAKIQNNDHSM